MRLPRRRLQGNKLIGGFWYRHTEKGGINERAPIDAGELVSDNRNSLVHQHLKELYILNGRLIPTIRRLSSHPVFEWFRE
jgi:hypothetical protein